MKKYINFYSGINIGRTITFAVIPDVIEKMIEFKMDYEGFFADFSMNKSLIVLKNSDSISIYTKDVLLLCKEATNEKGLLLVIKVKRNDLKSQNNALSNGIKMDFYNIAVKITVPQYPYRYYVNGVEVDFRNFPCSEEFVIDEINECFISDNNDGNISIDSGTNREQSDRVYSKILDLAENYSDIYDQIERRKIMETEPVIYSEVGVSDAERIDRISYIFTIRKFYDLNYKVGAQVRINDKYTGEITKIDSEFSCTYITILFNDIIERSSIDEKGTIQLSYSSIISEVQKGAISNLRNNTSPASYIHKLLGVFEVAPYRKRIEINSKNTGLELNKKQRFAVEKSINTKDIMLIMGPPGTGKTTVIVELIRWLVCKMGLKVLVSSQNNTAIDNVMKKLPKDKSLMEATIRIGTSVSI